MKDTGIPAVENEARVSMYFKAAISIPKQHPNPLWSEGQCDEMSVRVLMHDELSKTLNKGISTSDLELLDEVLFRIIFPTITVYLLGKDWKL